jgi:hypothetical protein
LMIIGDYTTQYVGDSDREIMGNPYKPSRI